MVNWNSPDGPSLNAITERGAAVKQLSIILSIILLAFSPKLFNPLVEAGDSRQQIFKDGRVIIDVVAHGRIPGEEREQFEYTMNFKWPGQKATTVVFMVSESPNRDSGKLIMDAERDGQVFLRAGLSEIYQDIFTDCGVWQSFDLDNDLDIDMMVNNKKPGQGGLECLFIYECKWVQGVLTGGHDEVSANGVIFRFVGGAWHPVKDPQAGATTR